MRFDMLCLPVDQLDIGTRAAGLLDPRIQLGPIDQVADLVQLGYVDELPLDQLLVLVEEGFLFPAPDIPRFDQGFLFFLRGNKPQLFVELGIVVPFPADNLK